jgi:NADH dehydrogenase [ubiquinone] 1 alpha subcomplex assembly factor 5
MNSAPFDPRLHRLHKARAAKGAYADAAFLEQRAAIDMLERLEAINRPFARVLTLGGVEALARARARADFAVAAEVSEGFGAIVLDPERLPFAPGAFDLILAPLSLCWANDLPGALVQLRLALAPDGLLLATLFGPETLRELRAVLLEAEAEVTGGAALRIAPFPELREAAGLLQRAGFALPAADREVTTVRFRDPFKLLSDLRGMGQTAALSSRAPPLRRETVARAAGLYQERYAFPDGRVPATFELMTLTGWAPHADQPKPLKPGSANARLADALGVTEHSAGEKPGET